MCLNIYIGSKNELPPVNWDDSEPGFYVTELSDEGTIEMVNKIIKSIHLYEAGSHMGCACGLSYGEWSKESEDENHYARIKDVKNFINYLQKNKNENELKLFCTYWEEFPDGYDTEEFNFHSINDMEFNFKEDKILLIK